MRQYIDHNLIEQCLREIHLEMRFNGFSGQDFQQLYPHITTKPPFLELKDKLEELYKPKGTFVGVVQIIYHWPDPEPVPITFHTDVPPEGKQYTTILGVALTEWTMENGTVLLKSKSGKDIFMYLMPGDVLEITPNQEHSPTINLSGLPRIGLYYRWVA